MTELYDPSPKNPRGYIYIISDEAETICKIGTSENPRKRFRSIQPYSPVKLKLVNTSYVADRFMAEAFLHYQLRDKHSHGEWFKITPAEAFAAMADVFSLSDKFMSWAKEHYQRFYVERVKKNADSLVQGPYEQNWP